MLKHHNKQGQYSTAANADQIAACIYTIPDGRV